jgi:hypothetical protein
LSKQDAFGPGINWFKTALSAFGEEEEIEKHNPRAAKGVVD